MAIASADPGLASFVQEAFWSPGFRPYTNSDLVGVEYAGALKNVIAIAAGVVQGLGLGSNTQAALITRGLAEMSRLTQAAGGRAETLSGLAGLGDLVLTCTGDLSRNRRVGMELGKGRSLREIVESMDMVAEGVFTADSALEVAARFNVELPISCQVARILRGETAANTAIRELMERSPKSE
jgi:glycerol-3-phosphate dehydrogenase (NAD(P)+)